MTACIVFNLAPLWVALGALVGLPLGYGLGWLVDANNLPRLVLQVFLDVRATERFLLAITTVSGVRS